jgi:dipeptide/tripeptide permease
LNKYRTIVTLSTLYTIGMTLLAVFSVPGVLGQPPQIPKWGPIMAIVFIAMGTGGIKPCVSSHGGDQFLNVQKYGLQKFYNYFYVAINAGKCVCTDRLLMVVVVVLLLLLHYSSFSALFFPVILIKLSPFCLYQ